MQRMKVTVTTMSPIVLTTESNTTVMTETHDTINGSILRGVIAKQYMDMRNLGKDAHLDEGFRRLFFGSLRFSDANLACPGGRRSFVLPLSMQKEKPKAAISGSKEPVCIQDMMRVADLNQGKKGMKSFGGFAVMTDDGLIRTVSVLKDVSLHMSRMSDEERKKGRSADGGIYNYESVSPGQKFIGYVIGDEAELSELRAQIGDTFECRIGRSKFTQYGRCCVALGVPKDVPRLSANDLEKDATILLRLDSPLLYSGMVEPQNDTVLTAEQVLEMIAKVMNARTDSNAFHCGRVFSANAEVENYVGVWGMKRPREHGLAAGTVFSLAKDGAWTEEDFEALTDILYRGVGRRTEEGFGQIRHWPEPKGLWTKASGDGEQKTVPAAVGKVSKEAAEIAKKSFERRIVEQLRIEAAINAKSAVHDTRTNGLSGLTHFFSRLSGILDNAKIETRQTAGLRTRYSHKLRDEIPPNGPLAGNLRMLRVNGRSLHDLLVEGFEVLHADCPVWKLLETNEQKTKAFMESIELKESDVNLTDGQFFYEYWHWFFRYARKKAVTKQKEAEGDA